jgi:mono/diheme cytochrome c family protein
MAALAFILFWVILGLGLLVIALRGGPRGRRADGERRATRRGGRAGVLVFGVAVLLLGAGIPAAVIATVGDRDDIPEANVSDLTPLEKRGRDLFGSNAQCRNCHTLAAAKAVAQVGPDLDQLRPPYGLVLDAIENGRARGNGSMAADLVEGRDAQAVAAFVAKAVGQEVPRNVPRE